MFRNKFKIAFFILLSVNFLIGGVWLLNHSEYYRGFLPRRDFDFETEFPKQPEANYYGWIGADRVDLNLSYGTATYNGSYVDKNGKDYELSNPAEMFIYETDLTWNVTEGVEMTKIGNLSLFAKDEDGKRIDITKGLSVFGINILHGTFTPKSGLSQDVYLNQDKRRVENWTSKPLKGKVYKGNNPERPVNYIETREGQFLFSYESWWFNQFKDGDEVVYTGKIREYANPEKYNGKEVKMGIFDIKSMAKFDPN